MINVITIMRIRGLWFFKEQFNSTKMLYRKLITNNCSYYTKIWLLVIQQLLI